MDYSSDGNLYFAELARDRLGDDRPDDLVRAAPLAGPLPHDFSWPFCHWVGTGPPELRSPVIGSPFADDAKIAPQVAGEGEQQRNATMNQYCQGECCQPRKPCI